ncbi:MAG: hypothetical protein D6693_04110 [Planctomycetota bacterium]|nr:MAG: hypothetical protein D6693_04110 [Planctomycetota bacterium]
MTTRRRIRSIVIASVLVGVGLSAAAAPALAQSRAQRPVDPRRDAAERLLRPMTVSFTDARAQDVMKFLADFTGARFDVAWIDDRNADGLDPEALVSLSVTDMPALAVLQRVLKQAYEGFDGATWQFAPDGEVQVGPKSRLNQYAVLKIYDIMDLLFRVTDFNEVPDLGLGEITQGQGGGSQSDFQVEDRNRLTEDETAQRIIDILIANIEPEQWLDAGGDGASITFFNGSLLVRAPDYIHRQIVGYSFWPTDRRGRSVRVGEGDRSTFEEHEAPAVADQKKQPKQN